MTDPSQPAAGLSLAEKRMLLTKLLQEKAQRAQTEYPLTHGQRGLWFLYQMNRSDPAYNIYFPFRIRSRLDMPAYRRALQTVYERHPTLRTTFEERDGQLLQRVHEKMADWFVMIDASSWSEEFLADRIEEEALRTFDLERGPVVRMYLFTRSPDEHVFLLSGHHIIGDLWSLVVILEEMQLLYPALCAGATLALPPPTLHYRDFVRWQADMLAGPEGQRLWSYWERQMAGEPPLLELSTDKIRPPRFLHRGGFVPCRLSPELTRRLRGLAAQEEVTLYTILLAAFQALLGRCSGQDDFAVGSPFAGRTRPGFQRVVGYFINMLPLRVNLSGDPTFRALLRQVGATVLDALQNQDFPFALLVDRLKIKRDLSRTPVFQATFALEKARLSLQVGAWRFRGPQNGDRYQVGGMQIEAYPMDHRTCHTDLDLVLEEGDGTVEGILQYNRDLFDPSTIRQMVGHFQTLLEGAAADPNCRLSELPWLTEAERRQVLSEWNETRVDYPKEVCLHQLFEQQAARVPEAVAVSCGERSIRYGELDAWANRIAQRLRGLGVRANTLVALCLERSLEMIAAILGTLKASGAYVPLDPASPAERLRSILADTGAPVLLTHPGRMAGAEWQVVAEEAGIAVLSPPDSASGTPSEFHPSASVTAKDLAYVIYTSGSTGRPKGVMVEHGSICNTVFWHRDVLDVRQEDRVLLLVPYFFDASLCVIFPALAAGAQLVLAEPGEERDPSRVLQRIARDRVTALPIPPGLLRLLLGGPMRETCQMLRWVCCGGETMPPDLPARLFEQLSVKLSNLYGPTEVAINATWWPCQSGDPLPDSIPIGRPIHNVQVYVLDAHRQPVPVGVPGELYIGGAGVARGYLNDPQLTAERFLPDPFSAVPGARLYRSGDRCRFLADGNLEFLGRLDHQVKVRGYRIELGEIEAALESAPGVQEAVVAAVPAVGEPGEARAGLPAGVDAGLRATGVADQRLVAYVIPRSGMELGIHEASPAVLRRHLKERLPEYMIPSTFVVLPELPRTPTGKVDRKALAALRAEGAGTLSSSRLPETALEEFLAESWRDLLQVAQVGAEDNFFELGGNSIQAALLITRVQEKLGRHVSMVAIFDAPTIAGLARHLIEVYPETIGGLFGSESLAGAGPAGPFTLERAAEPPLLAPELSPLLVPLQPSWFLPPCFMVHPPGGIVVCYQSLARYMEEDRPFYGIRARGLHGEQALPTRLEEMAAEYVTAIRGVQPEGPYHLGGWSMGGVIAFEMAQQLLAQGQRIGALLLLDTTIPLHPANQDFAVSGQDSAQEYGLDITLRELDALGPDEQLPYLWDHVQKLGLLDVDTPLPVVQQILNDLKRLFHAHITLANDYVVRPYPGRITLFRPIEAPVVVPTPDDRGWSKVARVVEVHFVPGHHHTMVKEPHVQVLAQQLRLCLCRDS